MIFVFFLNKVISVGLVYVLRSKIIHHSWVGVSVVPIVFVPRVGSVPELRGGEIGFGRAAPVLQRLTCFTAHTLLAPEPLQHRQVSVCTCISTRCMHDYLLDLTIVRFFQCQNKWLG